MDHFFGDCKFFLYIWKEVCKSLNVGFTWDKSCLEANIFCWHNLHSLSADIPYFVLWEVWGVKNILIFQEGYIDPLHVSIRVIYRLNDHGCLAMNPNTINIC